VIDLTGGDQPFISDDGETIVVFNGEVYNHQSLRRDLEQRGHRFRSGCDTEVVLHAFLEWDTQCFRHLRGMFAIALLSKSDRRLVLARDRMGIKPLYFCRRGSNLYFGSELKAILEHEEVSPVLDLIALQEYLSFNYVPSERTLLEGIQKLAPGHLLEWRNGEMRTEAWWRLESTVQKGGPEQREGRVGFANEGGCWRTACFRRTPGSLGKWRTRFFGYSSLCRRGKPCPFEDFFNFV
jgi:asparagine synthase (glutamine-hydrolysing)